MAERDYTVRLSRVFQGPMDLLLHLVREQEVEIQEIEISSILTDYLAYLEKLESLDIEVAGDFLVMAATLMAIKSRSLLPNEEIDLEEELDPKDELIQRLLEYRRFKGAAEALEDSKRIRDRMVPRGWHEKPKKPERTFELGELTAWDLLATFSRLMRETLADRPHHVVRDPRPLRYYVDEVVHRLRADGHASLRTLMSSFGSAPPREALVGSFCALLELVRLQVISVRQDGVGEDIEIEVRPEHEADFEEIVAGTQFDEEADEEGETGDANTAPAEAGSESGPRTESGGDPGSESGPDSGAGVGTPVAGT